MFYRFQSFCFGFSFIKFTPNYFTPFDAFVNSFVFLILFLDCLLQVCRNTIDFSVLILYSTTLPNLMINSNFSFF